MTFDGQDDCVQLPEMEFDFSRGFTVEAWVYFSSHPHMATVINLSNPNGHNDIVLKNSNDSDQISFSLDGGGYAIYEAMENEKWLHLAVTMETSRQTKVYKNGSEIASNYYNIFPINIKRTINHIGKQNSRDEGFFHGRLGEIRLWNLTRSPAEITENMGRQLTGNEQGLVGYWPLNEEDGTIAYDKSSNANHGIIKGATAQQQKLEPSLTSETKNDQSNAGTKSKNDGESSRQSVLTFNGTSDYISVPDSKSLQISAYTVEVWIKPNGKPNEAWKGIVGKPGRNYNIWINNTGYVHHRFHTKGSTNAGAPNTAKSSIKWNQWSHVAITNDGKTAKTYINGQLKKQGPTGGALIVDQTPLYIARQLDGNDGRYFKGQIADIRIWNQVHSQEEIKNLMNQRLKGDESGLVAYWPLNEGNGTTATDQTSNGNQGTIHGGTWTQEELDFITPISSTVSTTMAETPSQSTQSVPTFDGQNDYIEVAYQPELNPAQFTLSCWVKVDGGQGKWRSPVTSRTAKGSTALGGYFLYAAQNNKWQFSIGDGKSWVSINDSDVVLNTWTHVAANHDGSTMKLYINGELVGAPVQSKINLNTSHPLRIGAGVTEGNPGYFFNGEITEVRLWNRARSQDEIKQLMNQRLKGDEAGLVGYWPLNEGSGTTVADKTNHKNSGTIHGANWKQEELDLSIPDSSKEETQTKELDPALTFDGKDDYISIALNEPETEVTHEFWFKTDSPNCGFFSVVIGNQWGYNDRHLYLSGGNIKTRIWSNEVISSSNLKLADNKWHHLAHVFGSSVGGQKIYIDGELVASGSKHTSDANKQDTIWIGYSGDAKKKYCQGQITDVRIWKIARSPEEIKQLMNQRLRGDEEGLLGYWPLNEGSGAIATDKTSNGNQGTIYGAGTWRKKGGGTWKQEEIDFLQPAPPKEPSPETSSEGESEQSQKPEEAGELLKQGPKGSSIKGTPFDIYPKEEVSQSRITSISAWHAWAIDNLQVKYKSPNFDSVVRCKQSPNQSGEQFSLEAGDYLTKISGTWGRQAPNYPKEEIITVQFHTHKGVSSKVFGGGSGKQQVEPFTLEAPEGQEIIGFFGNHGGRQDILTSLGIYLKPVEEPAPAPEEQPDPSSNLSTAITFDGKKDYIDIPPDSTLDLINDFTIEAWIKPEILGKRVVDKNIGGQSEGFTFDTHPKNLRFINKGVYLTSRNELKTGTWQHVAVTFKNEANGAKLYINGEEENTATPNKVGTVTKLPVRIASQADKLGNLFKGDMAEVRMWNRVRSQDEIKQSMNHRLRGDEAGLVGYWPLNEGSGTTIADKTSNDNPGTLHGGTWKQDALDFIQPAPPKQETTPSPSALTFNGTSDFISVPDSKSLQISAYTVEVWIKPSGQPDEEWKGIVGKPHRNYHIWINNDGYVHHCFQTDEDDYVKAPNTRNGSVKWDEWNHVAITNDGKIARTYINGELQTEGLTGGTLVVEQNPLYIARSLNAKSSRYFKGQLVDIRIWAQVRTPQEIQACMNCRLTGKESGLVAYWPLDEGGGTIAKDKTSNGNDGAIAGAVWQEEELDFITPVSPQPVLTCDGKDDYVATTLDAQPSALAATTWEAWVKPTRNINNWDMILCTDDGGWDRFVAQNSGQFRISHGSGAWSAVDADINQWQHIAVVYTADNQIKFYKNGTEYVYESKSTIGATKHPLYIGRSPGNATQCFQGSISEVRVWNYVREQAEIQRDMHHRLKGDERGLVGYWPLNEGSGNTATDKTGNENPGTIQGGTWEQEELDLITPAYPKEETTPSPSALTFNGTSDFISVPDSKSLQISAYTVEVWMKPSGQPDEQWKGIVGKSYRNYHIWIHKDGYVRHRFQTEKGTNAGPPNTPNGSLTWDEWTHVAITYDGKVAQTYINGELKEEGLTEGTLVVAQNPLYIARNLYGKSNSYFKGQLADIRIWAQVRTPQEIQACMNCRLTGKESGLVAYWPLDEGGGIIAKDKTSNGNNGAIAGAVWQEEELDFITPASPEEKATTDKEQAATDSEQETTDSEKTTTDSEQETTDSEKTTTDSEQATTDSEKTTTDSGQATTDSEQPATDKEKLPSVLTFDGKDDFIDCGSGINLTNTSFTIEFWAKRKITGKFDLIVSQGEQKKNHCLHIGFRDSDLFTLAFWGDDLNTGKFTDTDWHHWSCVYDQQRQQQIIYRDGQLEACRQPANYQGTGNFYIGALKGTSAFFEGQLADLRIWQEVRTPQEIQDAMNSRLTGNESGLMAYWPLDEGEGTTIKDKTGNGNDGTITGAVWEQMEIPFEDAESSSNLSIVITYDGHTESVEIPSDSTLNVINDFFVVFKWGVAHIEEERIKVKMKIPKPDKKSSR